MEERKSEMKELHRIDGVMNHRVYPAITKKDEDTLLPAEFITQKGGTCHSKVMLNTMNIPAYQFVDLQQRDAVPGYLMLTA
jgi:hypothetical protein